jgi:hypothetical protein
MARKTVGYVHLEWTCPNCQTKNRGVDSTCSACGGPQPADVDFKQGKDQALIQDEKTIEKAKKGADIHCAFCGARNQADAKSCVQCSADLSEGARRESGQVLGAFKPKEGPLPPQNCPSCGVENPGEAQTCSSCGGRLGKTAEVESPEDSREASQIGITAAKPKAGAKKRGCGVFGLVALGIVILGGLGLLLMGLLKKDTFPASVGNVEWMRSLEIEALQEVTKEEWEDSIPVGGEIISCKQEYRFTQDQPAPGAEEVCGEPYTVDSGSGVGEVVQDCEYRVYDEYCQYSIEEWAVIDEIALRGSNYNIQWPNPELNENQRLGRETESYTIYFISKGNTYEYSADDEQEFRQYPTGSNWNLTVNGLGIIVSIDPN